MENKPFFYLVLIFSIINIIDCITAMFILPGEANPLFLLFGSFIVLVLFKLFLTGLVIYVYKRNKFPSNFWYYNMIYILVIGIFLYGFGIYSNILGMLNPKIIQASASMATTLKLSYYKDVVIFLGMIPYALGIISFKLYEVSVKNIKYEEKKHGIERDRNRSS